MIVLPSQIILIAAILLFVLYAFQMRTLLRDRLIYLALVSAGLIFILFPELSTRVANLVGIGRGADLVLYTFIVVALFNHVSLISRMRGLERQLTQLVRTIAVDEPRSVPEQPAATPTGQAPAQPAAELHGRTA